jgi:hypothetical protein
MAQFEYRVVPAPVRGIKAKGARTPEDRFAQALAEVMNDLGRDGWEYLRCDTLPSEERTGLTGRTTVYRNMLVFRRQVQAAASTAAVSPASATPASFAARVAATLRPGAPSPAAARVVSPAAPAEDPTPEAEDRSPAAAPVLGPADRGQVGAAPRLVADRDDPDTRRLRPDGSAAV